MAKSLQISSSLGFNITTDGVHLNWRGAELFASAVNRVLDGEENRKNTV